jgi:alpha-mannosidase
MVGDTAIEVATVMVAELEYIRSIESFTVLAEDGTELIHVVREPAGTLVTPPIRRQLAELRTARAGEPVSVRVTTPPAVTVLAHVTDVAGYGWQAWTGASSPAAPVTATDLELHNGVVTVVVDPADGTFAIDGHGGLGRLVDGGDVGDTYNWCPPDQDVVVDTPSAVSTRIVEAGPVRGRLEITRTYDLPTHAADGTRAGSRPVEVLTTLELHAGDDLVRVHVELDNHGVRDHRLRVVLPLPERAPTSVAECAFGTVERGLVAEGGATEQPLATYPSRRFVCAGGLTVAHEGLLEYELIDLDDTSRTAGALAVTLLRCTGMLSQGPMATRPLPAGPMTPMEGPQSQHRVEARFAVHLGGRDPYAVVDDHSLPLQVSRGGGSTSTGPLSGRALSITGAEVSAIVREAGQLVVRVFNPTPEPTTVTIDGRSGWLVDLRGRPLQPFEGSFDLKPWQITSVNVGD